MPTPAEIVDKIDTAVAALVDGQAEEVEVDGKRYKSHNLSTLKDIRKYYADLAGIENASAAAMLGRAVAGIPTRRW